MKNFAIISDGVVREVFVADSAEIATAAHPGSVEISGRAWIGWSYVDGVFVAPVSEEVTDVEGA